MKIALLGTRGVPATHGGFETCVEEVGKRLSEKGHEVIVYSKAPVEKEKRLKEYLGMKIVYVPWLPVKGFATLFASIFSAIHSLFLRCDFHMIFNGANSPAAIFYKLLKKKYAINTDGLEWQRLKWGFIGQNYYKMSERISVFLCDNLVSDSQGIHDYYKNKYNAESTIIAYGADLPKVYPEDKVQKILKEYGLEKNKYFLQVTRFEPENHPLLTLQAFNSLNPKDLKCVIIGGANYESNYADRIEVEEAKNENIVLPGFIYNKEKLSIIWENALSYVHGNMVGGTNPALLQAMAAGRPVIALDCVFNREVLDNNGYFFNANIEGLTKSFKDFLKDRDNAEKFALKCVDRIKTVYTWEKVADQYEQLFLKS